MTGRDPAAGRWAVIQWVRAVGVACAVLGIVIVSRRVAAFAGFPESLGYLLLAAGLIDTFVAPAVLARRWRSPPP